MVHVLPARALDGEPNGDVITEYRFMTNGPHRLGMALKIKLGHREIDENGINAG